MTKYRSKAILIKDIEAERRRLENVLAAITEGDMTQSGVIGEWSVKDILAHLVAWEQQFLTWYKDGLNEVVSEINPVGMSRKAIDLFNQQVFEKYRRTPLKDVMASFTASYTQTLTIICAIPEEDMFIQGKYLWTGKYILADYIAANTCSHYYWAKNHIRKWLKFQGRG